jgi:hypothetical protein
MIRFLSVFSAIFLFVLIFSPLIHAQISESSSEQNQSLSYYSEDEFQVSLTKHVRQLLTNYYAESLPQEKFLIALMRLVNHEMDNRITNRGEAIEKYFTELRNQLKELQQLKGRLNSAQIYELDSFITELEKRMKMALESGEINYKQKKVFEDALQLLYIAEEMIKLDQLSDRSNLSRNIDQSKDRLLNAFGEVGNLDLVPLDVAPTIFNLFDEWTKTDSYKYSARLLDIKIVRSKLLKSGTIEQVNRMFNDQLKYAYTNFNYFEYDLADRVLEDLIETYREIGVKDFEDVYYYRGECNFALNRSFKAQEIFQTLLEEYPQSVYLAGIYSRLIQISYKFGEYNKVRSLFTNYQNVSSPGQEDYYDVQFIVALSMYEQADYNRAIEILLSFPEKSDYYYFAQYMIGTIYAAGQNYDLAYGVLEPLIESKKTPQEFYNRSLLKLAQISYERGDYLTAIKYAELIPDNFIRYDKVLNILTWSHFTIQQTSQSYPDNRDYSQAKLYAYKLLEEFYSSEYRMEAQSLLGYIYQSENDLSLARDFYQDVYKSKVERNDLVESLLTTDSLRSQYLKSLTDVEDALQQDDRQGYASASSSSESLNRKMWDQRIEDKAIIGEQVSGEITNLINQLTELDQLKSQAQEQNNTYATLRIDEQMNRIRTALDAYSDVEIRQTLYINSFPVAKKVATYDFNVQKNEELRNEILDELLLIDGQIQKLNVDIERARLTTNYELLVVLEQKVRHLEEMKKKYDQLYSYSMELSPGETYAEFDRWGEFGAVGIIDVNFGQRDKLQDQMSQVSTVYNSIVDKLVKRREVVEDQLKKIEAEIRFMTMKARLEERQRLRAEREQSFRETYFDTRTTEFEEK